MDCHIGFAKTAYRRDSQVKAKWLLNLFDTKIHKVNVPHLFLNYYNNRAYVSGLNKDFDDTVSQNLLGLRLETYLGNDVYHLRFENNLGLTYKAIGVNKDAIRHLDRAARLFESKNRTQNQGIAYLNMGATYTDLE